jgi:soluble lytic murein transglycosylase-like protein
MITGNMAKEKWIVTFPSLRFLVFFLIAILVGPCGHRECWGGEGQFYREETISELKGWVSMLREGDYAGLLSRADPGSITDEFRDLDLFLKGLAAYETGDIGLGEDLRKQLIEKFPESIFSDYISVDAAFHFLKKDDVEEAKKRVSGRVKKEPLFYREGSRFLYVQGKILLAEDKERPGVESLVECVRRYPGTEPARLAERIVLPLLLRKGAAKTGAGLGQTVLAFGNALAGEGRYQEAASVLVPWGKMVGTRLGGKFDLALANSLRRMNRYTDAIDILMKGREGESRNSAAEKLFFAGIYNWYRGRVEEAEKLLKRVLKEYGGTIAYGKSAYNLGRIKEEKGRLQEAFTYYKTAAASARNNSGAESSFRMGLVKFLAKDYGLAEKVFSKNLEKFSDEEYFFRNLFLKAYSLEKKGEIKRAQSIYDRIVKEEKGGLYYFLSLKKLGKFNGWKSLGKIPFKEITSEGLLEKVSRNLKDDARKVSRLTRAITFQKLGLYSFSLDELARARLKDVAAEGAPRRVKRAISAYASGNFRRGIELSMGPDFALNSAGDRYLESGLYVQYPALSFIISGSGEGNPDPFFLHSIIRQESLFDYSVISSAGAIGLGQIMPRTGQWIAKRLGVDNFSMETLFDPLTNSTFARFYIENLIRLFRGDFLSATAAYNAGEAAAERWRAKSGGDPYLFPEIIGYEETRKYVRKVFMNYLYYLKIYGEGWGEPVKQR